VASWGPERALVEEVSVLAIGPADLAPDRREGGVERASLDVLEGQGNDRIALEMRPRRGGARDRKTCEERAPVLARFFDEVAERREVHRLAEATGAGQQQDLGSAVEHPGDEVRLVDVEDPRLAQLAEVRDADRQPRGGFEAHGWPARDPYHEGLRERSLDAARAEVPLDVWIRLTQ
jgi:hypothetical protein